MMRSAAMTPQDSPNGLIKHTLQIPLRERRTFHVLHSPNLLGNQHSLFVLDGGAPLLPQAILSRLVISEIELRADEDNGNSGCVMLNFRVPLRRSPSVLYQAQPRQNTHLGLDVVKRRWAHDRKADEEDVSLGVR